MAKTDENDICEQDFAYLTERGTLLPHILLFVYDDLMEFPSDFEERSSAHHWQVKVILAKLPLNTNLCSLVGARLHGRCDPVDVHFPNYGRRVVVIGLWRHLKRNGEKPPPPTTRMVFKIAAPRSERRRAFLLDGNGGQAPSPRSGAKGAYDPLRARSAANHNGVDVIRSRPTGHQFRHGRGRNDRACGDAAGRTNGQPALAASWIDAEDGHARRFSGR